MLLNEAKTKTMIFNYTNNHKFSTRLSVNEKNIQVVENTKLLGTIISENIDREEKSSGDLTQPKQYSKV